MREPPPPPPPLIADVVPDDGIAWARLVTAIVLLALSLGIGYRTGREPPRPKAVPQPVRERVVAGVALGPPVGLQVAAPVPSAGDATTASTAPAPAPASVESRPRAQSRQVDAPAKRSPASGAVRLRRHHPVFAAREGATARRSVRTRAQVRNEYLRSREVVAALTGEDSGSAYLSAVAERRRTQRAERAGHRTW